MNEKTDNIFFSHYEGFLWGDINSLPPNESDIHAIREIIETRFQGLWLDDTPPPSEEKDSRPNPVLTRYMSFE